MLDKLDCLLRKDGTTAKPSSKEDEVEGGEDLFEVIQLTFS